MKNDDAKALCLALMRADREDEVVKLLADAGYWDDSDCWRYYGDDEMNWNRAGNQQARTDFAVNEKLVNAIDSRLMLECMRSGLRVDDPQAPSTIRGAVGHFIEKSSSEKLKTTSGRVEDWPADYRRKVAEGISVFTTGAADAKPCINVADLGEGHTPEAFPITFVGLGKKNKTSVRFVQGKFGQGGTGAIRYCGRRKLQLIVSRRHPELVGNSLVAPTYPQHETDDQWGFTVVRREDAGPNNRLPFISYLAPIGSKGSPRAGRVLRFAAKTLPIFPKGDRAYGRDVAHGSLLKLYEYDLKQASNILRRDGLRPKIDLLLPEPALPIRFHECRSKYTTEAASEQTETMSGLFARLRNSENLEPLVPDAIPLKVLGHSLTARIFAFKPDRSKTYRNNEGVVFTVNGQAHGYIKANIFARSKVGLQRLAKDLLVVVDCSDLSPTDLDDLFMSSRDRLVDDSPLAGEIERRLEEELRDHAGLKALKSLRAQQDINEQLSDNKPFEEVLKQLLKSSPSLARLFGRGDRLSSPFNPKRVQPSAEPYVGKKHPTYFHFASKAPNEPLERAAHLESKVRLSFETDADNDYFTRNYDPGEVTFWRESSGTNYAVADYSGPKLVNGHASLTFDLPPDSVVGDSLIYKIEVRDAVTERVFINSVTLKVMAAHEPRQPGSRAKRKPSSNDPGTQDQHPDGLAFPEVHWVKHDDVRWSQHFSLIDDCLNIIDDGEEIDGTFRSKWVFYLNENNRALEAELKHTKLSIPVLRKQFEVAIVLVGLALVNEDQQRPERGTEENDDGERSSEELSKRAQTFTRALAPFIIPMIQGLAELGDDKSDLSDLIGKAA